MPMLGDWMPTLRARGEPPVLTIAGVDGTRSGLRFVPRTTPTMSTRRTLPRYLEVVTVRLSAVRAVLGEPTCFRILSHWPVYAF